MSNYEVVVHDDRYSLPVRRMVVVTDERQVRVIAERVLIESSHHLGVEVLEYGAKVFGLGVAAEPSRPLPSWSAPGREQKPSLGRPDPRNA